MNQFAKKIIMAAMLVIPSALMAAPVDINTATAQQIDEAVKGVGPVKAQAIVEDREKNGPFKSVDDLTRVKGIGEATVEKNRNNMTTGSSESEQSPAPVPAPVPAPEVTPAAPEVEK